MPVNRRVAQSMPPPPGHDFNKADDPSPLRTELARLRHEEWKRTSVGDGRGAAEAACIRMALLRGYAACFAELERENETGRKAARALLEVLDAFATASFGDPQDALAEWVTRGEGGE